MKVQTKVLQAALKSLKPVIPANAQIAAYEGVKIADGYISGTNGEVAVGVPFSAELPPMVLEYATLSAALEKLQADEIDISETPTGVLLKYGRTKIAVPTIGTIKEYPTVKADKNGPTCNLTRRDIEKIFGLRAFVTGPNDTREAMRHIGFNGSSFMATNGHLLGVYDIEGDTEKSCILPIGLFAVLSGFAGATHYIFKAGSVKVIKRVEATEENETETEAVLAQIKFRTVEGVFPNVLSVIPDTSKHYIAEFESEEMVDALEVLECGANKTTGWVSFEFDRAGGINASASDSLVNREASTGITSNNTGLKENVAIGFTSKLLSKALKYIGGEETTMYFNEPSKVIVLRSEDHDGLVLVMPVFIAEK